MNRAFRRFAVSIAGAVGVLVIDPSTAVASDFSGFFEVMVLLLAKMAAGALLLAPATEAILARIYRRKFSWIRTSLFAVGWFIVIWYGFQWWQDRPRPVQVPPRNIPKAEQFVPPKPEDGPGR